MVAILYIQDTECDMVAILYKQTPNTKCDMVAILYKQTQNAIWLLILYIQTQNVIWLLYYINKHNAT